MPRDEPPLIEGTYRVKGEREPLINHNSPLFPASWAGWGWAERIMYLVLFFGVMAGVRALANWLFH